MLNTWKTFVLCITLALAQTSHGASLDDVVKARESVRLAELAMVAKDYAAAAERMEDAFAHDPNPLWLANAGYARMLSGQQDRAVENLSKALNDARLTGLARDSATDRLARASAARAHLARSDEAKSAGDLEAAARAQDSAFQQVAVGSYALEAGLLWERAGLLDLAEERFMLAARQDDLAPGQRRDAADALVRVAKARAAPPPVKPDPGPLEPVAPAVASGSNTAAWVLIASGAAVAGLGVVGFVLSESDTSEFDNAARDGNGALLLSRADAEALESSATTWLNVGVFASAVGGLALVTGIVLLVVADGEPETRSDVHIGGSLFGSGGLVTASGRF